MSRLILLITILLLTNKCESRSAQGTSNNDYNGRDAVTKTYLVESIDEDSGQIKTYLEESIDEIGSQAEHSDYCIAPGLCLPPRFPGRMPPGPGGMPGPAGRGRPSFYFG